MLSRRELDAIRLRLERAPPGPYVVFETLGGYQLVAGVLVEPSGRFTPLHQGLVPYVLALPGGRDFASQAWDDVRRLLLHVEGLERGAS